MLVKQDFTAIVAAGLLGLIAVGATPTAAVADAGASQGIAWTVCPQPEAAQYAAQCGTLTVPVDWNDPSGPTIGLALMRVPATGTSTGTVVADSEDLVGFGGSQISFFLQHGSNYLSRLPRTHVTKDIVIFDPRGLGESAPLACSVAGHDPRVSSLPTSLDAYKGLRVHNADVAASCEGAPNLSAHMGIRDQVRDVDALRAALGRSQLDWMGQVVGGELGAAYAATHPARVGHVVVDSPVDPYRSAAVRADDAARAEETVFQHFATWCAQVTPDDCALHGRDPGQVLDQAVALADAGGVSDGSTPPQPLTGAEIRIAVGQFLLGYPFSWTALSGGISDAATGDGSTLAGIAAMTYTDPDYTASRAQTCDDSPAPSTFAGLRGLVHQVGEIAPHTGGVSMAWEAMAGCVGRRPTARPLTLPTAARAASAVLVTATTGDPISPTTWSRDVAAKLAGSRALIVEGDGHGAFDNSACVAGAIDTYLADGALPAAGTLCRSS
jgi:pimeloyl-ACP methyl ester carboxylesterase